jgi:isoamylase
MNWFDWSLLERHADVLRFARLLIARRLLRDVEHEQRRVSLSQMLHDANKAWHGVKLNQPDWGENSRSVALTAELRNEKILIHLILNAYWESLEFELPPTKGNPWRRWIDTSLRSPDDVVDWKTAPLVSGNYYPAGQRSVVMLYSIIE